ncbi:hypothetical protein K2X85_06440 [bacterium]|nr:hypothetical protein [bacterium]
MPVSNQTLQQAKLVAIVVITAWLWLMVLPALSRTRPVEHRSAWLEEAGIDPAAFNYSDHRAGREMIPALDRLHDSLIGRDVGQPAK